MKLVRGFPGIFWKTYWVNGLKFCMLMYSDHLQNCLDYGYSFLIFKKILMLFWLSETGQIWGFHSILVMLCGYSSLWWPFGWKWSYLGFLGIIWRTCGSKCRGGSGGIFPTLCVEFFLVTKYCQSNRTCKYFILSVHPLYCQLGAEDPQFSRRLIFTITPSYLLH